ncbi:MAG: hypothetical protein ACOVP6_06980 [Lacibacter sp.]
MRYILLISCLLIHSMLTAQFSKGTQMVGSTLGTAFTNSGQTQYTFESALSQSYRMNSNSGGFSVTPSYGRFLTPAFVLGFSLNAGTSVTKNKMVSQNGNTFQYDKKNAFNLGAGAFGRYYVTDKTSILPYSQLSFSVGTFNQQSSGFYFVETPLSRFDYDSESTGGFYTNFALALGFTKMLSSYTGLDVYAGYNFSSNKLKETYTTLVDYDNNNTLDETRKSEPQSKFNNHGFVFGLGFQVFLAPVSKKTKQESSK